MGKLFNSMLLGSVLMIAMYLFNGSGQNSPTLVGLLLNPTGWKSSEFISLFAFAGISTLAGGIAIGLGAILKQDWITRAGWIGILMPIVIQPYVSFFTTINSFTGFIDPTCVGSATFCNSLSYSGQIGQVIGYLLVGPLFLYAVWACIEWVWKGDGW